MPIPKTPVQGDAARLEQIGVGLKQQGGTHGPLVQKNDVGRPSTGQSAPAPSQPQIAVTPEMQAAFTELAQAELARQYWQQLAAISPTPWVQAMREIADRNYQPAAAKVYNITPNAEW